MVRLALATLTLATAATVAAAADLPARTRIGAVFADQPIVVYPAETVVAAPVVGWPWVANSPRVAGYYGRPGDFYYRSYYGTPDYVIFSRPPFSCAWYGGQC